MRICHLTSVHAYNDTRIFHKECASLAHAHYDVNLIAPVNKRFSEKNVNIIPVGSWSGRYHRLFIILPKVLVKAIKIKAQVYHIHDPELLLIVPLLKLTGAKVIYDIHEDYTTSILQKTYLPKGFRGLLSSIFAVYETLISRLCIQIIAEKYYIKRFPHAIEILNYPILEDRMQSGIHKLPTKKVDMFDSRYFWFLYTGNVTVDRGAILNLKLLKAHKLTALAYIGKCTKQLSQKIYRTAEKYNISKDRIKIIGIENFVPRETIDYYTYSGKWIAGVALFPETPHYVNKELTKFFEYMAAGLPILCSCFQVWKRIIEENSCGICIDVNDMDSVTSTLNRLLNNSATVISMGENGIKAVNARYKWEYEEKKLLEIYKKNVR